MKILGFVGPKGSGKDTSYELLKEAKLVDGKISFAAPLKAVCGKVFGLHFNILNDPDLKELPFKEPIKLTRKHIRAIIDACEEYVPSVSKDGTVLFRANTVSTIGLEGQEFKTPRELMQIIGTELIRDRMHKGWHRAAAFSEKALEKLKKSGTYAVTDVRFMDEHEFLIRRFGLDYHAYYVDRPSASKALDEAIASGTAHPSESETQKIREGLTNRIIDNSGSMSDLKDKLVELVSDIKTSSTSEEVVAPPKGSRFKFAPK